MEETAAKEVSCRLDIIEGRLTIRDPNNLLSAIHRSQMFYWGMQFDSSTRSYSGSHQDMDRIIRKITGYFERQEIPLLLTAEIEGILNTGDQSKIELDQARLRGAQLKNGEVGLEEYVDFLSFIDERIVRTLKQHQLKAALHLLEVSNGANFSVPGSGKTTVVLTVFHWLRYIGRANSLFVIGPPSCFGPWEAEYEAVIGNKPKIERLAGGDINNRTSKYYVNSDALSDLYLTTYQTLQRDYEQVRFLFNQQDHKFFLVIDEAHYIKQPDGAWPKAVLSVAPFAKIRCVLTGTPFPHSYVDSFNLFDVLWPKESPLNQDARIKIQSFSKGNRQKEAVSVLDKSIGSLFYRVRKHDLGLAPQDFRSPILVKMNQYERIAYDAVVGRIRELSKRDYFRDLDLKMSLQRGRMIRLRQAVSYTKLLQTAISEYEEELLDDEVSLKEIILSYDRFEKPAKLEALTAIVDALRKRSEKVVIWSNFVGTLKLIVKHLRTRGHTTELIYGETPTDKTSERDELTREEIINKFLLPTSELDILVANPAACAESISLHKQCSHAIYYDLSYNCAQYLQSLDRIHRVGGSEDKMATYHFLQYADTVDSDILENVRDKAMRMSALIDQDYPIYELDMFSIDDEITAYERLFE